MAVTKKKTTVRRSSRVKKQAAPAAPKQANLTDSNGEITAHDRYKDVDKAATKMFEARDQVAIHDEVRKDQLERIQTLLNDHGHQGVYHVDHAGSKYKLQVENKEKLSISKCKKGDLEAAG